MTVRNFHPELLPKWLYPGTLAIPNGGKPRRVEPIKINAPIYEERTVMYFGKEMQ